MGGAASEVTGATTDILVESAHFDPIDGRPVLAPPQAGHRGVQALRARRRRRPGRGCRPAGRRTCCRSSAGECPTRASPTSTCAGRATPVRLDADAPGPAGGAAVVRAGRRRHAARDRLRGRRHRRRPTSPCCRRAGAPTCRTAPTSSRRSPACAATTRSRPCCPRPPAAAGSPTTSAYAGWSPTTLAHHGLAEVLTYPFVGREGARPARAGGRRPAAHRPARWPTRCPRRRR